MPGPSFMFITAFAGLMCLGFFARGALLDENCKGGRALTKETRASLKALAAGPATQAADQR